MSIFETSDLTKLADVAANNCSYASLSITEYDFATAKSELGNVFTLVSHLLTVIDSTDLPVKPTIQPVSP